MLLGTGAPAFGLVGSTSWPSWIRSQAVNAWVNSAVYQSFELRGAAVGAVVAVDDGVAATGDGAWTDDTAGCARPLCAEISFAPRTRINHSARSMGIGSGGGRLAAAGAPMRPADCGGANIVSKSSTPLKPWGTGLRIKRVSGMAGFPRSARNCSLFVSLYVTLTGMRNARSLRKVSDAG